MNNTNDDIKRIGTDLLATQPTLLCTEVKTSAIVAEILRASPNILFIDEEIKMNDQLDYAHTFLGFLPKHINFRWFIQTRILYQNITKKQSSGLFVEIADFRAQANTIWA